MRIEILNINKSFGDKKVLENFSACFTSEQPIFITGVSGAGKTTLLNIIMGLEKADSGVVRSDAKRFSAVFQEDRLCPDLSAVMNVGIALERGRSLDIARRILSELGIDPGDFHRPVTELSGGQMRRVALARALAVMKKSDAGIFDEPFRGLDEGTKMLAARSIKRHCRGKLIIAVTHDAEDAALFGAKTITVPKI